MTPPIVRRALLLGIACIACTPARGELDLGALPKALPGFSVNFFAREPDFINPSALCFDKHGRLYIGAGPQFRKPRQDSPTDYIKILIDADDDGVAETVRTFAEGFNSIQGLAWKGDELWVANAPELTVLRDTNGDDIADEYQVIYTGLGNLRHGLHGLNWAPDGWLYMSSGNTRAENHAPLAFRKLMRIDSDEPAPYPLTKVYSAKTYPKTYSSLVERETEGGILRCREGGRNLEVYARGMRNPWDICFDDAFTWMAMDNDPGPPGDRIFMPLQYGHYSMRHPWMFDWRGQSPAVAPASLLFEGMSGSGTGVAWYQSDHFPPEYRNLYLVADWTNQRLSFYRPMWDGALQVPAENMIRVLDAGKTEGGSMEYVGRRGKSLFRPTDIAVGPGGAVFVAGWGSLYGTKYVPKSEWTAQESAKYQGRVFRLRHENPLIARETWHPAKRDKPISTWPLSELIVDLAQQLPIWRVNAQDEIVRRGKNARANLIKAIESGTLTRGQQTWCIWALGRIDRGTGEYRRILAHALGERQPGNLNLRIQAVRILGENRVTAARSELIGLLDDPEPRIRLAAIQSLQKTGFGDRSAAVISALADETDRCTFYTGWQVLRRQLPTDTRRSLLAHERPGARLMAMLSLMEEEQAVAFDMTPLRHDDDERVRDMAKVWLQKTGDSERSVTVIIDTNERNFHDKATVTMGADRKVAIHFTMDGSEPSPKSWKYSVPLPFNRDVTLKAAAFEDGRQVSNVAKINLHKITKAEWDDRIFVRDLKAGSIGRYEVVDDGLQRGVRAYADDASTFITVPDRMAGATMIRTSMRDAGGAAADFISFKINIPAMLYVAYDSRFEPPQWLTDHFEKMSDILTTSAAVNGKPGADGGHYTIYRQNVPVGLVTLGGGAPAKGAGAAMYHVFLTKVGSGETTIAAAESALARADIGHGRELFFGRGTCVACHKIGVKGVALGPDLNDIAARRDVKHVITSILNPDDEIVEGYRQTSIELHDGSMLYGMVQEETAQRLTIFLATGQKLVVETKEILKREDAKTSGMPSSFRQTLSVQDVADLSAWLITRSQKK